MTYDENESESESCSVQLFATQWTIQSMEFSRPEYWSGHPFPSPGDLPNSGIKPRSPALRADSLPSWATWEAQEYCSGSLSLLQEIFPTQESNQVLLHYRQILYQLSYEHIFSWLKSKHTYSLVKYLLGLFFHYSFGFFVFIQSCKSSLYILNVSLISNMECIYFLLVFVLSFYFLKGVF